LRGGVLIIQADSIEFYQTGYFAKYLQIDILIKAAYYVYLQMIFDWILLLISGIG